LIQAFLKKWWVESDFKAPNLPLSLRLKVSGCHYNSIYNNTWTKQVKQLSNQHQTQWSKCVMVTDAYSLNNKWIPSSVTIKPFLLVTTMNHSVSHLRVLVSLNIFIRTINWRVFFNVTLFFLNRQNSIIK
jgi:hypothetical protein